VGGVITFLSMLHDDSLHTSGGSSP